MKSTLHYYWPTMKEAPGVGVPHTFGPCPESTLITLPTTLGTNSAGMNAPQKTLSQQGVSEKWGISLAGLADYDNSKFTLRESA